MPSIFSRSASLSSFFLISSGLNVASKYRDEPAVNFNMLCILCYLYGHISRANKKIAHWKFPFDFPAEQLLGRIFFRSIIVAIQIGIHFIICDKRIKSASNWSEYYQMSADQPPADPLNASRTSKNITNSRSTEDANEWLRSLSVFNPIDHIKLISFVLRGQLYKLNLSKR